MFGRRILSLIFAMGLVFSWLSFEQGAVGRGVLFAVPTLAVVVLGVVLFLRVNRAFRSVNGPATSSPAASDPGARREVRTAAALCAVLGVALVVVALAVLSAAADETASAGWIVVGIVAALPTVVGVVLATAAVRMFWFQVEGALAAVPSLYGVFGIAVFPVMSALTSDIDAVPVLLGTGLLVALAAGTLPLVKRAERALAGSHDVSLPDEAARVAEQHGLGRHLGTHVIPKQGRARAVDVGRRLHAFDGGLVRHDPGAQPEVFRWDQVATVHQNATQHHTYGSYAHTGFAYRLTRVDAAQLLITGTFVDPALGRNAAPDSPGLRLHEVGRIASLQVAQARLPFAEAALTRGEDVAFGKFVLNATGVRVGRQTVPWESLGGLEIEQGAVTAKHTSGKWFLPVPVNAIPNLPLLLALVDSRRQSAARSG